MPYLQGDNINCIARIFCVIACIALSVAGAKGQECEWLNVEGGAGSQISYTVTIDKANDVIIAGYHTDSFSVAGINLPKTGASNALIIKYDAKGNFKWVVNTSSSTSSGYCSFYTSTTDNNRNIYVSGNMSGTTNFGNGVSFTNSGSGPCNVLVKYDSNGVAQWVRGITGSSTGGGYLKLKTDKHNNILMGFVFSSSVSIVGTSITINTKGGYDLFIAKYTPAGDLIRAKNFGGTKDDIFNAFGCDDKNNVYVLGYSFGDFTFGPNQLKDSGEIILKMDSAFNPIKGRKTDLHINVFYPPSWGIAVLDNGTFATVSQLYDSVNYGNGVYLVSPWSMSNYAQKRQMSIVYYDANLNALWARKNTPISAVSTTTPIGGIHESNDYLYFGGTLEKGSVKFGSSIMNFVGTSTTPQMFVAKMDLRGNFLWAFTNDDPNSMSLMQGLATDYIGDALLTGIFSIKLKMFNKTKNAKVSGQQYDIFIAKIADYTITRGYVKSGPYCAGDTIVVPYTKKGNFDIGNEFIAELSDSTGNFETGYRELGRVTDTAAGVIKGLLPLFNVASNNRYRIRILSTKPIVQSFYRVDTLRLLIYSKDTANAGNDTAICKGQSIRLGTTGGSRWLWSPAAFMPNPADSNNRQPLVKPDSTTEYRIIISDSSGCGKIDTDFVVVIVRPDIKAAINGDSVICQGYRQNLKAVITGGDSAHYWYQWRIIGLNIDLSTADTLSVAPLATSKYRLVAGDSCSGKIDTVFFTVRIDNFFKAIPSPDTIICKGKSATLRATANGCNPKYYKYQWFENGNPTLLSTANIYSVTPLTTTTYTVIVSDSTTVMADTAEIKVSVDNVFNVNATKDATICRGQFITLQGETLSCDTSQMEYAWDNGLGKGQTKTVSPMVTTTYIVTGTNKFNGLNDTARVIVTVNPPLKITLNPDTSICKGQTARLQAATQGGNTPTHHILWTANGGLWTDTNKTVTVSPTKTTTYTAILTDGCTANADSAKITVTVGAPLKITVNADTNICVGQTAQLRATLAGGNPATHTVRWTVDNGPWTANNPTVIVSPATSSVYKAVLSDGCTILTDSAQIRVTVRLPLKVSINTDTTICTGQSAQLRAIATGGYVPQRTIQWTDGSLWTSNNNTETVSPTATTTYTATLKDNCTVNADSAKITVIVRPPLQLSITSRDSICSNQILLLTANPTGGYPPNYSIQWTVDNAPWTSALNPVTDTPKTTTTYTASLSDNCSPTVKTSKKIVVLPTPVADFTITPNEGCPSLPVVFTDNSTGNDTAQNTWKAELTETRGITVYNHLFAKPGSYTIGLSVSNALGCSDYTLKKNAVTVFDKPTALFAVKPDIKEIETPLLLYNYSQRATAYTWDFGDGNIIYRNNRNDITYSYKDTGNFSIDLIAENEKGCKDTLRQTIHVFDKINCVIPSAFTPNDDKLNNVFAPVCVGVAQYTMTIYNRWGQIVQQCENCAWDGTFADTPVPSGVYMYKIQLNAESHKKSLVFGMVNVIR